MSIKAIILFILEWILIYYIFFCNIFILPLLICSGYVELIKIVKWTITKWLIYLSNSFKLQKRMDLVIGIAIKRYLKKNSIMQEVCGLE